MSNLLRLVSLGSRLAGIRQIAIPARAAVIPQPTLRFYSSAAVHENRIRESNDREPALQRTLKELNNQVQSTGRVSARTVESAINAAEARGYLKSVETQLLLRATGGFLKELTGAERSKLGERILKLTSPNELDISHYNTLLYVKLENGTPFEPSEFLKQLADAGITPNRVTYQRLAQRYCEIGDIQNATKIVEFMKTQNLSITDRMFHAFIIGHLRAGNEDEARNVLNIMTSANVKPTAETYTVLAEGLIECGNIAGALEVISEQPLLDEQVLRVVKALAMKDELDYVDQVLLILRNSTTNFSNMNNVCLDLLVAGKPDAAYAVFNKTRIFGQRRGFPNFLLLQVARSGYPVSELYRACEIVGEELPDYLLLEAARHGISLENRAHVYEYIEELEKRDLPIRPHFYLPLICKAPDEAGVLSELKYMNSKGLRPTYEMLSNFILPRLDTTDAGTAYEELLQVGAEPGVTSNALAHHMLREHRFVECEQFLRDKPLAHKTKLAGYLGALAIADEVEIPIAITILGHIVRQASADMSRPDVVAAFLRNGTRVNPALIEALGASRLPLSSVAFERLKARGVYVEPLVPNLGEFEEIRIPDRWEEEMSTEDLEKQLSLPGMPEKEAKRKMKILLNAYCKMRDIDKVEKWLKRMSPDDLSGANLSFLVEFFASRKDFDRAFSYYEQARQKDIYLNPYRVLTLAQLLVERKQLDEAGSFLEREGEVFADGKGSFDIEMNVSRLLKAVLVNYGVEVCFDFFHQRLFKYTESRCFGPLIRELIPVDTSGAFEIFKEVAQKYKVLPYRRLVCKRLIEENMTEELDTFTGIVGQVTTPSDCCMTLLSSYFELGRTEEAKKLLPRLVNSSGKRFLIRELNQWMMDSQLEKVTGMLKLLDEAGLMKDVTIFFRIKLCNRNDDYTSALDHWTEAQEENIVLLPSTLEILATLLERNQQPVPFVLPDPSNMQGIDGTVTSKRTKFLEILEKSVDDALEYRGALKLAGKSLPNIEILALVEELVAQGRIAEGFKVIEDYPDLRRGEVRRGCVEKLLGIAGERGMIEELQSFVDFTDGSMGRFPLQKAYQQAGRIEEYLTKIENEPLDKVGFFLSVDLLSNPSVGRRLAQLAHRKATELKNYRKIAELWYYYVIMNQSEKSVDLMQQFPELSSFIETFRVPYSLKTHFDLNLLKKIVELVENESIRSRVFLTTVRHLTRKEKIDEAEQCLQYAKEIGIDVTGCPPRLERLVDAETSRDLPSTETEEAEARSS